MKRVKLGEIVENKDSKRIPVKASDREKMSGKYPYYGASGIVDFVDDYLFEGPNLLIGEDGANLLSRSTDIAFIADGKYWVNNHAHVLGADNIEILHYLRYFINNIDLSPFVTGSAQPKLNQRNLNNIEIPLPSLSEQKAIVAKLDRAQRLIDIDREMLAKYDELIQSVFLEMFGDPVRNEKGFVKGTIRDIVSETKYGTNKKAHETEGEYPVIRMGNLLYNGEWDFSDMKYCDLEENELPKYLVHKGDVLFNRTNSKELVGKTGVYREEQPIAYAGYLIRVRPNEKSTSGYISGYLNCPHGKLVLEHMCKNIVGMANINAQELQDIKISIPPIELQKEYEQKVNEIRKQKRIIEAELTKSEELFSSLVQGIFG